jgi:NAD(P)H-hydrate epimerase
LPSASDAVVAARLTVALGALKESLLTPIGGEHAGRLFVADIGLPPEAIDAEPAPVVRLATAPVVRAWLPARGPHAHKGTCGHVVVVAGSVGKTGAAHLAALGALRSGAGLVTVATPSSCLSIVASLGAEYMTAALPDDGDGRAAGGAVEVLERLPGVEAWVVGPGLGTTEATARIVAWVAQRGLPVVFDADALPAAAPLLERRRDARPLAVVTPHPGEMARLLGVSTERVQARRVGTALDEARRLGAVVLLKGAFSVTATPHGLAWVNPSGNPGMATAGTGDVLAGIVGGWLAQGLDVEAAAALGAYLHGAAGDRAARRLGEHALMARDLLDDVGPALVELGDAAPDRSIGRVS